MAGNIPSRHRERRIVMLANFALAYNRKILAGAANTVARCGFARLYHCDHFQSEAILSGRHPRFDGVLLGACEPALELPRLFASSSIPIIDTSGEISPPPLPRVISDDQAVGRMAAEYFLKRGFSRFMFWGFADFHWSQLRFDGFNAELLRYGLKSTAFVCAYSEAWDLAATAEKLVSRLARAGEPSTAVFCANDSLAASVLEACLHVNILVPEQAAILGVDDDDMHTQLRKPHISSIQLQCQRIGSVAMEMLLKANLSQGQRRKSGPSEQILIPPFAVISRQSSDIVAVDDQLVRNATAYIRDHLHEGLNVKQLSYAMKVSRTTLETRFKEVIGRRPAEEVRRQRTERAKALLSSSRMPVGEIARRVGFSSAQLFSESFRRFEKATPLTYRNAAGKTDFSAG